jgi:hypothetical protein
MAWRAARAGLIAGIVGATAVAVSYVTSPLDIVDLELVSVKAFRLKDVAALKGAMTPETPVFEVRFSTASDFVSLANQPDGYSINGRVLVGDAGCNPDLDTFTYTNVAEMLIDFARVYDESGDIMGRSLWSRSGEAGRHIFYFYFGVYPGRFDEFVHLGLDEAPLCFELAGVSRTGRALYSNIVPLPKDVLAQAASPLAKP